MGRSPCCAKVGLNRGAWTAMEDKILTDYIKLHGEGRWRALPKRAGLKRCGKSCRLRWLNYLRPDIKRGNITVDEEELIIRLHKLLGNRWSLIAGRIPGRTDNEIKNYWNTNLSKRVQGLHCLSNVKQSDKTKVTKLPTGTHTMHRRDPVPNVVIRTKAVKCTRVFINPPQPVAPPAPIPPAGGPQMRVDAPIGTIVDDITANNLVLSEGLTEGPLMDFPETDFGMIGELNFSEFMDSQQMLDICCELSHVMSPERDRFSTSSSPEEPIVFSEEMMDDWRMSGCGLDVSAFDFWLGE